MVVSLSMVSLPEPGTPHAMTLDADTEGNGAPVDPLAALEKTTNAQNHLNQVQVPRLEALQSVSEHYNADPYSLSSKVRKRFREDKKIEKEKKAIDDALKGRYGLPETLALVAEDDESKLEAKSEWEKGKSELSKKRRKITSSLTSSNPVDGLRARILTNTSKIPRK